MLPSAIVFDLWYTLVCPEDHAWPRMRTSDAIPAALGVEPAPFAEFWRGCFAQRYRDPRPMGEYVADYLESLGRAMSADDLRAVDAVYTYHDRALAAPRAEVVEALKGLRAAGLRLGLLSNAHEREIRTWTASPLAACFDAACFSCFIGCAKPEAEAYSRVLDQLGVPASRAVFVGDGASSELAGARAAGFAQAILMRGLLRDTGLEPDVIAAHASHADAGIDRIAELRALLDQTSG